MNVVDFFWFYGPAGIWFLGVTIFFSAIVWLINTQRIIKELTKTTAELRRGASELQHITSELRQDTNELRSGTCDLRNSTHELKEELGLTRSSINNFDRTLRKVYSFWNWFPSNE